jgi:hypothetical protein
VRRWKSEPDFAYVTTQSSKDCRVAVSTGGEDGSKDRRKPAGIPKPEVKKDEEKTFFKQYFKFCYLISRRGGILTKAIVCTKYGPSEVLQLKEEIITMDHNEKT